MPTGRPEPGSRVVGSGEPGIVHVIGGEAAGGGVVLVCGIYVPQMGVKFLFEMMTTKCPTCLWCVANRRSR